MPMPVTVFKKWIRHIDTQLYWIRMYNVYFLYLVAKMLSEMKNGRLRL